MPEKCVRYEWHLIRVWPAATGLRVPDHAVRRDVRMIDRGGLEAAIDGDVQPWLISFKGTPAMVTEMLPILGSLRDPDELCDVLLKCYLSHVVGDRPDRYEARVVKRWPKPFKLMRKPRHEYNPSEA